MSRCERWDPATGDHATFDSPEAAPEGWLPFHPDDTEKYEMYGIAPPGAEPPADPAVKLLTKAELTAALKEGGVTHDTKATRDELDALLTGVLHKVLDARGESFVQGTPTRTLLEQVRAK